MNFSLFSIFGYCLALTANIGAVLRVRPREKWESSHDRTWRFAIGGLLFVTALGGLEIGMSTRPFGSPRSGASLRQGNPAQKGIQ